MKEDIFTRVYKALDQIVNEKKLIFLFAKYFGKRRIISSSGRSTPRGHGTLSPSIARVIGIEEKRGLFFTRTYQVLEILGEVHFCHDKPEILVRNSPDHYTEMDEIREFMSRITGINVRQYSISREHVRIKVEKPLMQLIGDAIRSKWMKNHSTSYSSPGSEKLARFLDVDLLAKKVQLLNSVSVKTNELQRLGGLIDKWNLFIRDFGRNNRYEVLVSNLNTIRGDVEQDIERLKEAVSKISSAEMKLRLSVKALELYEETKEIVTEPDGHRSMVQNQIDSTLAFTDETVRIVNEVFYESELRSMANLGMPVDIMASQVEERLREGDTFQKLSQ